MRVRVIHPGSERFMRLILSKGLFVILILLIVRFFASGSYAQSFVCDVGLNSYRVNNNVVDKKPDFSGRARMAVDTKNAQWIVDYVDNRQKYACSYPNFILEKPNYTGMTNEWRMVSLAVDGYPVDLDFDQRLFWFTYCARDYLRERQGQPLILPFGNTRLDCYVHGTRLDAKWRSSADLCPESARFTFDSELFKLGVSQLSSEAPGSVLNDREAQFARFVNFHTNGQTIASFRVTEWSALEKVNIPSAWQFDFYWYGHLSFSCNGTANNLKVLDGKISLPDIPQKSLVTDKRVRNAALRINNVQYAITNGHIPALADLRLPRSIRDTDFAQMPPDLRNPRWIIIALLVATGLFPLVFWLYRNNK